jgi:hypothetical protein
MQPMTLAKDYILGAVLAAASSARHRHLHQQPLLYSHDIAMHAFSSTSKSCTPSISSTALV